jgi:hypothetical protein
LASLKLIPTSPLSFITIVILVVTALIVSLRDVKISAHRQLATKPCCFFSLVRHRHTGMRLLLLPRYSWGRSRQLVASVVRVEGVALSSDTGIPALFPGEERPVRKLIVGAAFV